MLVYKYDAVNVGILASNGIQKIYELITLDKELLLFECSRYLMLLILRIIIYYF